MDNILHSCSLLSGACMMAFSNRCQHTTGSVPVQDQTSNPSGVVSSGGSMTPAELMRQCNGSSRFLNSSVQARTDLYRSQADTETLLRRTQMTHCTSLFLCLKLYSQQCLPQVSQIALQPVHFGIWKFPLDVFYCSAEDRFPHQQCASRHVNVTSHLCCFSRLLLAIYTCASFAAKARAAAKPTPVFAPVIRYTLPCTPGICSVTTLMLVDILPLCSTSHLLIWNASWAPIEVEHHVVVIKSVVCQGELRGLFRAGPRGCTATSYA